MSISIRVIFCLASAISAGSPILKAAGLSGIESVFVSVESSGVDPNSIGLPGIESLVKIEINNAGLTLAGSRQNAVPELRICIKVLQDQNDLVYHIQTGLYRNVDIDGQGGIWAGVWNSPAVLAKSRVCEINDLRQQALKQVKSFTTAVKSEQRACIKKESSPKPSAIKTSSSGLSRNASENGYVGSKNSKVFHKEGCSQAGRINSENQVHYKTKLEAINSGKRPCKICNP